MNKFKFVLLGQKLHFSILFYREIISDTTNIAPHSAHGIFARDCKSGGDGRLYQIGTVVSDCCTTTHSNCNKKKYQNKLGEKAKSAAFLIGNLKFCRILEQLSLIVVPQLTVTALKNIKIN